MSISFRSPSDIARETGINMLVYGAAGSGKTMLCATSDEPTLIISNEAGLLTIANTKANVKVYEVKSLEQLGAIYQHLIDGTKFGLVCMDSLSEMAETVLQEEMRKTKNALKAYGEMANQVTALIRSFRDLAAYDVLMTTKVEQVQDDNNRLLYSPSAPGKSLKAGMPYFFDIVAAMRIDKDSEGSVNHWLQCRGDGQYLAKDRTGLLDHFEEPNLAKIKAKILGTQTTVKAA